jgi:hypothetical protein
MLDESMALSNQLEALVRGYRELGGGRWMMAEIHSNDLIASLTRRLVGAPLQLTATGLPDWLYGDSFRLGPTRPASALHAATGVRRSIAAPQRNRIYLDLIGEENRSHATAGVWSTGRSSAGPGRSPGRPCCAAMAVMTLEPTGWVSMARLRIPLASARPERRDVRPAASARIL